MKTITLKQACSLLDLASYIYPNSVGEDMEHHSYGYSEDEYDEFLGLSYHGGRDVNDDNDIKFIAGDNLSVEIDKDRMYLISEDGNKEEIQLFIYPENLEEYFKAKKKKK